MTGTWNDNEDWHDDEDDESDEEDAARCPECGGPIHEVTDKCPECGYWLLEADHRAMRPWLNRPRWQKIVAAIIVVLFFACLLMAGWTIF